jgi:hypothetical protein
VVSSIYAVARVTHAVMKDSDAVIAASTHGAVNIACMLSTVHVAFIQTTLMPL